MQNQTSIRSTNDIAHTDTAGDRDGDDDEEEEEDDDDDETLVEIERSILRVFGDTYCNKHLVYGIVELILLRLLPELAEEGVIELLAERLA